MCGPFRDTVGTRARQMLDFLSPEVQEAASTHVTANKEAIRPLFNSLLKALVENPGDRAFLEDMERADKLRKKQEEHREWENIRKINEARSKAADERWRQETRRTRTSPRSPQVPDLPRFE